MSGKIEVFVQKSRTGSVEHLGVDLVTALADPCYCGGYFLKDKGLPPIREGDIFHMKDHYWFASNFGLMPSNCGETLLQGNGKKYKIFPLTNEPFMIEARPDSDSLNKCVLKLFDAGHKHLVQASFNDVMLALAERGYVPKPWSELPESGFDKIHLARKLREEQMSNITPEFVKRMNELFFNNTYTALNECEAEIRKRWVKPRFY